MALKQPLFAYKTAENCLVILLIPEGALTNISRDDVVCAKTAKFRCDRATVMAIQDWRNGEYRTNVLSDRTMSKKVCYKIGQEVVITDFNHKKYSVCTTGIHFFLSPIGAYAWYSQYGFKDSGLYYNQKNHKKAIKTVLKMMKKSQVGICCPKYIRRSKILKTLK
jgi:hypothetical protein